MNEAQRAPAVSRAVRGAFIAWWLVLTAVLALSVEGALFLAALDCHGYEDGLVCQSGVTMSLAGVGLLAVAAAGVLLARRASRRVLLISALGFGVIAGGSVSGISPVINNRLPAHRDF